MSDLENLKWLVLYTKPRNEKVVADRIEQLGIESYCPLRRSKNRWSDRWKWVETPLIKSYCFVKINPLKIKQIHSIPGMLKVLYWNGKPATVRDEEINRLKACLMDFDHDSLEVIKCDVGDRVLLKSGPFMDLKGDVIEKTGRFFSVQLVELGITVRVNTKANLFERIS
ncbi:MAG: UpxY family transcription antiterminator [Bacteroidetes bacterium]|nr:UpxY family transcription antiterminator [Bacteroidota bacterium]